MEAWTAFGRTIDCPMPLFGLQRKSPRQDAVQILHHEKETFPTVIRLQAILGHRFPRHRRKAAADASFRVHNQSQCVDVAVASAVKFLCFETIATAPPQNSEIPPPNRVGKPSKTSTEWKLLFLFVSVSKSLKDSV
jgi:uncharacterized protein (UPF0147 family)